MMLVRTFFQETSNGPCLKEICVSDEGGVSDTRQIPRENRNEDRFLQLDQLTIGNI